jgi:hypothetical protein
MAEADQHRAGLIYFGMPLLQVLSFFILMKHDTIMQAFLLLLQNNLPCNGMKVSFR